MRTEQEMMELIMNKAISDDKIRAVAMDGSKANINAVHDNYSDFDIVYYVTDVREFTKDKAWINYFGDILIVQCPMDWYSQPYNYSSHDRFTYLMQLADGNRIDLSIVDIQNISKEALNNEPRIILLNKDNFKELLPIDNEKAFYIKKPDELEFYNTCNEFRWICTYISKGLFRKEIYYAKYAYDVLAMDMFMKMLNFKIAADNDFQVTTGSHSKYLKRFLSTSEMDRLHSIFPNGEYEDIWNKMFIMYDYFHELEIYVSNKLRFDINRYETDRVRQFIENRGKMVRKAEQSGVKKH